MKKILIGIIVVVSILIVLSYVIFFTSFGNSLLKPVIESQINKKLPQKIVLQTFKLSPSDIKLYIKLEKGSYVKAEGEYSLFSKSFDIDYDVKIAELSKISPLTGVNLRGPFATKGSVKGDLKRINIVGKTDIAKSDGQYTLLLKDLEPASLEANINGMHIEDLLYMVYQPRFLAGTIQIIVDIPNLNPKSLDGKVSVNMLDGVINREIMKKDFNVTLPKTDIKFALDAKLDKTKVDYVADIASNLAKIDSKGEVDIDRLAFDIKYALNIKELALFRPIAKINIQGPFKTQGTVKGDNKLLEILGKSDIASSITNYNLILKDFKPDVAKVDIKGAKLAKILYMLSQPIYADASIDVHAKIKSFDMENLSGEVVTYVKEGKTFPKVLYKEFNLTDAKVGFNVTQRTIIENSIAKTVLKVDSTVAKADMKNGVYDIKKNIFTSDFTLFVPDLDKLYFATKKHLKGDIKIIGKIKKDKDLLVMAHSETLGGKVDFKLLNDKITKKIRDIKVTALTDMLIYPRVFDSTMDADLTYNIKSKKGVLSAKLLKGRILPNQMTFLLSQMAKFDITKEIYEETIIDSKIDDKVFISNLDMKSRLTHITSKNALLDMNKNRVDTKLRIDIRKRPVYVKVKGDINKPKVSIDAKELLKDKLEKKLEKKIPQKYKEPLKEILKLF
ncbi:hypothetical protein [Nitrosophilus labii]|uniref:hypothetical protein n=1 Tax=Nitrosophilus labii TaxID=2706014 RepID=UPI0016575A6F|nr:hypothetical protein [Nitrosophilus labii]